MLLYHLSSGSQSPSPAQHRLRAHCCVWLHKHFPESLLSFYSLALGRRQQHIENIHRSIKTELQRCRCDNAPSWSVCLPSIKFQFRFIRSLAVRFHTTLSTACPIYGNEGAVKLKLKLNLSTSTALKTITQISHSVAKVWKPKKIRYTKSLLWDTKSKSVVIFFSFKCLNWFDE